MIFLNVNATLTWELAMQIAAAMAIARLIWLICG